MKKSIQKTGIYTITNLINGKMIVGSGILEDRKSHHFWSLKNNKHCNPHLQNSFNENGGKNFIFEIIEECEHEFCPDIENWWINMLDTKNPNKGYNVETPGKGRIGVKNSIEQNKNIGLGNKNSPRMLGKKHSEETKKKISESNIGNKISEETKKKISKAILGTKHSEESRRKNSEAHKGINTWMKGTKMSEYNKLKLVETNSIPILQFDKQGNFIKEWKSAAEAGKQLNINYTHISSCVRKDKHRKTAGGYKWELKIIEKYDRNIK